MCGICGVFNYGNKSMEITESLISMMRDTMIHRGPDGAGSWLAPDRKIGLGHRRLSIIDLSPTANQPMANEDGTIVIVYNGEIYNHAEIKPELVNKRHRFRTDHSDTEVIIHAYEEWGKGCLERFRGMFAFALWDGNKNELWLVRDRIGIKPLYYTFTNGVFLFASEIKSLLAYPGIKREVNEEALYHYLTFLIPPAPLTLFEGINKLPAGHTLTVTNRGDTRLEEYWDVFDHAQVLDNKPEEFYLENIMSLLRESVKYRMVSDVPVGVFLSGGIDSSTNVALFSEFATEPVRTFSIGFKGQEKYNEFPYAREISRQFSTQHHEILIDVDDLIKFLPDMVYYQDEPIADPVCVPLYYVSRLARDHGVIVCQVGEGSDELFCGYPRWGTMLKLHDLSKYWRACPYPLRWGLLKGLEIMGKATNVRYELLRRAHQGEAIFWSGAEAFTETEKKEIFSPRLKEKFRQKSSYEITRHFYQRFLERSPLRDFLNFMGYMDLKLRLPELLLMRVDKMSMGTSLEARVPFLDHKFVEFCMSIPQSVKVKNGVLKYILKKAVQEVLSDEIIQRPKQGFGAPIEEWFLGKLGDFVRAKLTDFCQRTDYFDRTVIQRKLLQKHSIHLWFLLNFVLWYERWIEKG